MLNEHPAVTLAQVSNFFNWYRSEQAIPDSVALKLSIGDDHIVSVFFHVLLKAVIKLVLFG